MKRIPELTEVIKIGQLNEEGDALDELYAMYVHPGTFDRIKRMHIEIDDHTTPGCCWIDKLELNGDSTGDDPICVADHHGYWLLKDFFGVPKKYWSKVRLQTE